jgi:hypothetical protein
MMGKVRKKSFKSEAISNVSEKETGIGPAKDEPGSLGVSTMSIKQAGTWCGLPSPWKRGTGREKVRNFLSNVHQPFWFPLPHHNGARSAIAVRG